MENQKKRTSGRMARKKEKTRRNIIETTIKMINQHGYDATTMEGIAAEADIAKGTLYNYFPVKEAIVDAFIRDTFAGKHEERVHSLQALPDTRTRMIALYTELMAGVERQKALFEKYLGYRMQNWVSFDHHDSEGSGLNLLTKEIIRLGQAHGELRSDYAPYVLEDLFESAFIEVVKVFYIDPESFDAQATIAGIVDLFLNGARFSK